MRCNRVEHLCNPREAIRDRCRPFPELSSQSSLLGATFSLTTLPGEFVPLIVAARSKQREARWVASSAAALGLEAGATVSPPVEIEPEPGL